MSSVQLGSNPSSLKAQRRLAESGVQLGRIYERLSSGQRINRASDDAAGLAIASSLDATRRVSSQGIRNFNDGISLLNVADGAIEQLSTIVIRLKELAEQAASGTYGDKQRRALDTEAQALSKEYFRIIKSTTFNGRGLLDASFGDLRLQGGFGLNGSVQSQLGGSIGTGTFTSIGSYSDGEFPRGVALGDLNGDGIVDLVTGGRGYTGLVNVRLGQGSGTFRNATSYATDNGTEESVALGDLNGDGTLDLVSTGYDGLTSVRIGRGDGTFGAKTVYAMDRYSQTVALGDLNGDGVLDLVTGGNEGSGIQLRYGRGNGTFGEAADNPTNAYLNDFSLGDLNGDGLLDLVVAGTNVTGIADIRLNQGNGTFSAAVSYAMESGGSRKVKLGDLNGDGILDLVTAGYGASSGLATVRLGQGNGTFAAATSYAMENTATYDVALGDLNGDGVLDIVTGGYSSAGIGCITTRLGVGNGTFGAATSYVAGTNATTGLALGELNGDGVLDIVSDDYDFGGYSASTNVRLGNSTSGNSPLLAFRLTSRADALQALSQFDQTLNRISAQRGVIGAFQSRVAVAGSVLQASTENYAAASARIKDTDVAEESAQLVRVQLLQQAASSVLAQANQQPALAIRLLRND